MFERFVSCIEMCDENEKEERNKFTKEMENLLPNDRVIEIIETKLLPNRDDVYYLSKYAWFPDGDTLNGWSYAICEDDLYGE